METSVNDTLMPILHPEGDPTVPRQIAFSAVMLLVTMSSLARAQEQPDPPKAEKEHAWLKQFVGQWQTEATATMGPDQPAIKSTGTMSSRMLGEFWVVSELVGTMPGMTVRAVQTVGYDPGKKKYVGTWVDSVTSHLWTYEGVVDDSGQTLVLEGEGPNFLAGGKMAEFRDTYTFKSKDLIISRSSMQREDGGWVEFMTGSFRRTK
jgi:hypothetical protein